VAQLLGISLRSVEKTWKKAMDQEARNEVVDFSNNRKMCGRKRRELNLDERVPQVPLNQRGTLRALARSLGVPFSTLQRRLAWGDLRRHTNSLKPYLSLENRLKRLLYCISMIDEPSITDAKLIFKMMGNIMHMDEKWFDMTKHNRTYYLTPEEPDPVRNIRNHNNQWRRTEKIEVGRNFKRKKMTQKNKLSRHINNLYDGKHSYSVLW
jgi:hypothetical protein